LAGEAVPITRAPNARAICTPNVPTPPAAPWISTVLCAPMPSLVSVR
jgi:hypothetical protein